MIRQGLTQRAFRPTVKETGLPDGVIGQVEGPALVYDLLDAHGTEFARGCIERTRRGKVKAGKVKLFWDHGDAPLQDGFYDSDLHIGTVRSLEDRQLPDGRWAAYMVADLIDTPKAREVKQYLVGVLASGGETGLSVGFTPRRKSRIPGGFRFDEIELSEISVTSMQSVPDSEVLAVRASKELDEETREWLRPKPQGQAAQRANLALLDAILPRIPAEVVLQRCRAAGIIEEPVRHATMEERLALLHQVDGEAA